MDYMDYEENFREDTYFSEQMESFSDEMLEFKDLSNVFLEPVEEASTHQEWLHLADKICSKKCFSSSECLQMLCSQSILNALEFEEDFETAMAVGNNISELPLFQKSERLQVQFAMSLMKCLELTYDSSESIILERLRDIPCFKTSKSIHSLYSDSLKILIDRTPVIKEKLILAELFPKIPQYSENIELQRRHAEALMEIADMAESLSNGKRITLMIRLIPGYGKVDDISNLYCQSLIHLLSLDNSDSINNELIKEIFSFPGFDNNEMLQHDMVDRMAKSINKNTKHEDILKILETARKLSLLNEVEVIHLQYLDLLNSYGIALAKKNMLGEIEWRDILKIYNTAINLPAVYPYETANVAVKFIRLFKSLQALNKNLPNFQAFKETMEEWLKSAAEKKDTIKLRMMGAGISYTRIWLPPEEQKEIEELTDKYCQEHQELFNNIDSLWNTFVNLNQ